MLGSLFIRHFHSDLLNTWFTFAALLESDRGRPVQLCRTAFGLRTLGIAAHQTALPARFTLSGIDSELLGFWAGANLNYLRRLVDVALSC